MPGRSPGQEVRGRGLGKVCACAEPAAGFPLGLRLECVLSVTARCSSRAGRRGRRWGTGPGSSGTAVGMGRAGRARTARWVELPGSLSPALGGGFLLSRASSRRRRPGLCGSPHCLAARPCAERRMLSCPSSQHQHNRSSSRELTGFLKNLYSRITFYIIYTCGVTGSRCAGANLSQKY